MLLRVKRSNLLAHVRLASGALHPLDDMDMDEGIYGSILYEVQDQT
jgi:hypothetical protein